MSSNKYTINPHGAVAGDRLLNVGNAARQLSDGSLVFLAYDPGATDPNKVSLMLATGSTRGTVSTIATLSTANFIASGYPQSLTVVRDDRHNPYVPVPATAHTDHDG